MRSTRLSFSLTIRRLGLAAVLASSAAFLAGCDEGGVSSGMEGSVRAAHPLSPEMLALMATKGVTKESPVLIRTYKKEAEFEIWKMKADGQYTLLRTYPMCRWSGQLGPKVKEGDRQLPEGFYKITPGQMNPNSAYYLSFNVGYPNAYDRAWNHTGGSIMVHGACSSAGCFSMTDKQIDEIYAVARDGFSGGQQAIQMQSYPFHMTAENMAKYREDPNIAFWKQLKEGADHFEVTKQDVQVGVCARHYVFDAVPASGGHFDPAAACPAMKHDGGIDADVAAKASKDDAKVAELVAGGLPAVRTIYSDGGQNPEFAKANLEDVSRPEAIAAGPTEWLVEPKGKKVSPVVKVAAARAASPSKAKPSDVKGGNLADSDASDSKTGSVKKAEAKKLGVSDHGTPKPQAMAAPAAQVAADTTSR
jgi:murein L,D-transpeptidase YafK